MTSSGSVTQWIGLLKAGDADAAQRLWQRYFERLVRLARKKLQGGRRRVADEEDAALGAFDSFCRGAREGQFPLLSDRHNLWPLLVLITSRKAIDLVQQEGRKKRGGGAVRGESALEEPASSASVKAGLDQLTGHEPTPEFAAQVAEECQRLLAKLPTAELRSVALWKLEGYTNREIAAKLGCVLTTVERKLRTIRTHWAQENASCSNTPPATGP
jgi:DNA-directed RNA polymerase specialized sigma24 family protein